jgi:DNA-binding MarR family transcriptional regulator
MHEHRSRAARAPVVTTSGAMPPGPPADPVMCQYLNSLMTSPDPAGAIRSALNRTDLAATRHRAALARVLELSENDVLALQYIARAGRLTSTQLATRLGLTSGGVTALVQRLERAGHVLREPHPDDRRSSLLRLSAAAERRLAEVLAPLIEQIQALSARLAEGEAELVARLLEELASAAEREAEALSSRADDLEAAGLSVPVPGLWA